MDDGFEDDNMTQDEQYLFNAANINDIETVKRLVENGVDFSKGNDSTFRLAASKGHVEIVKLLSEEGAEIEANNNDALIQAARNGHIDVVKYLVRLGADVHAAQDSAMSFASFNGHVDICEYLYKFGGDYQLLCTAMWNKFHKQIEKRSDDIESIIKYVGNRSLVTMYGHRALKTSINLKKFQTIRFLLMNGGDINLIGRHWQHLFDETPPFKFEDKQKKWESGSNLNTNESTEAVIVPIDEYTDEECIAMYEVPEVDDLYLKCPHGHVLLYRVWMALTNRKNQCQYCTVELDVKTVYRQIVKPGDEPLLEPEEEPYLSEDEIVIKEIKDYFINSKFPDGIPGYSVLKTNTENSNIIPGIVIL